MNRWSRDDAPATTDAGMRIMQCTVGRRAAVVVVFDGQGEHGVMLADERAAGDGGFVGWIEAARRAEQPLRDLLAEHARSAGEAAIVDDRNLVVRTASGEYPIRVPVDAPEVWAAGVTYLRSRDAREEESSPHHSADFYSRVYEAERPELFLKDASCRRTVPAGHDVAVRGDSSWTVPEPEIGLVLDASGAIVGFTIGNDISARDIEGQNPLYLTQSKTYVGSCALGPAVWLPPSPADRHHFEIAMRIVRDETVLFEGAISTEAMRREFAELASHLLAYNLIADGTVLLTGTGIVPPEHVSLEEGDRVDITVPRIGTLSNGVRQLRRDPARRAVTTTP